MPVVEGLVPLNPHHWTAHAAATAFTSDFELISDPQLKILDNCETTLAYLSTASSATEAVEPTQLFLKILKSHFYKHEKSILSS